MTNNKRTIRRVAAAAALTFAFSAAVAPWVVFAATVTWTGVTGVPCLPGANVWSLNGSFGLCWSNGSGPANGDDVLLSLNGPSLPSTYDINRTFNSLTLNTSTVAATPGYTVSNAGGFVLGLQSGGFITDNNTRGPDAINTGITLNGPATFTLSAGATQLSFGGNATIGAGPLMLVNNGANDGLALNVANTYTGATTVNGTGRVKASVNGAIPTGSAVTVNSGASLLFGASSTIGSLAGGECRARQHHAHRGRRQHQHHLLRRALRRRRPDQGG